MKTFYATLADKIETLKYYAYKQNNKMKTQTISRNDLLNLHGKVGNDWKVTIGELALKQSGDKIEVRNELIKRIYGQANEQQKKMLNGLFQINALSDWQNIRSLLDVFDALNVRKEDYILFEKPKNKRERYLNACSLIPLISKALNEDWIADFTNNEPKWYGWFERKSEAGWRLVVSNYYDSGSCVGSGFYFQSKEKMGHSWKYFESVWLDYLPE